jgi:outer membrane protein OmpA-like peptidoglycan-associated protein
VGEGRRTGAGRAGSGHAVTVGVTDLMTSLAVIFVLLLVVFVNASRSTEPAAAAAAPPELPPPSAAADQTRAMLQHASPAGLTLEADPTDPQVLRVVIPDSLLNFEFGKSTLSPAADRFLAELMPAYAATLCAARDQLAGIVIEGHTDDLGSDVLNLRLSQDRSFSVLVRGLEAIRTAAPQAHGCFSDLASASGRGRHDLVYDDQQRPDRERSRRVVLKILLRPAPARAS